MDILFNSSLGFAEGTETKTEKSERLFHRRLLRSIFFSSGVDQQNGTSAEGEAPFEPALTPAR
jgi:hypothetical protein